ncbi:hypothetical protein F4777DRAFT_587639 [Nemania sp. FL0916]|nr:hypothetical protein F4777DRAFT_587639 [Nemania sp. FL0916]
MASSFIDSALRLIMRRKPGEGRMADEHAQAIMARVNGEPAATAAGPQAGDPFAPGADRHRPVYINPDDDPLTFFRLMLGIQTTPYLGFTLSSPLGTRPAANIGLYARIIHAEQKAKDSFKVFSVVINGCYFLQIVIAAALTALGAAGAGRGAITAFGALNTVIAGFLTFLKGSGLPGRLKYYGNEWKKIREYIEQRERDFMRPGHNLNVFDVVETIEKMYNNLKTDIEMNTPDSYNSISRQRQANEKDDHKVGGFDISKLGDLASKLKGLDSSGRLENLAANLGRHGEGVSAGLAQRERQIADLQEGVISDVEGQRARLNRTATEHEAATRAAIADGKLAATAARDDAVGQRDRLTNALDEERQRLNRAATEQHMRTLDTISGTGRAAQEGIDRTADNVHGSISSLLREINEIHRTAVSGGRQAASEHIQNLAHRLRGGGDHDDEKKPGADPKPDPGKS